MSSENESDSFEPSDRSRTSELSSRFDIAKHLNGIFGGICEGEESKLHIAARRGNHEMVTFC